MSDWKPNLYMEFGKERTQPSIDLVTRITSENPKRIIDIGCGPGNSTNVLKSRWRQAGIIGLDSSNAMINEAKSKYSDVNWICADTSEDLTGLGKFDIVFSNAAIQWMPDQELLLSKLYGMLNDNGVLAVQVPCTKYMPIDIELKQLTLSEKWKSHFVSVSNTYSTYTADFYYNILCNLTHKIDLWETDYFHIMNSHSDIVKWYSGSGLRPYFDCLKNDSLISDFSNDYEICLGEVYPSQSDGKVLFPFTRIFFIAQKI